MATRRKPKRIQPRKCLHCRELYTPTPQNAHKQEFCGREKCQDASHRVSQRKYQNKNPDDEATKARNKERTVEWRKENPKYWLRVREIIVIKVFVSRRSGYKPGSGVRIEHRKTGLLCDNSLRQAVQWVALVVCIDDALRDLAGKILGWLYDWGHEIKAEVCGRSRKKPWKTRKKAKGRKTKDRRRP